MRTRLVSDAAIGERLKHYMATTKAGTGPVLPPQYPMYSTGSAVLENLWNNYTPAYNGNSAHVVVGTPTTSSSAPQMRPILKV